MIILKIGGSVITDKTKKKAFKPSVMDNISAQIKNAKQSIMIVHGAGSFGHVLAKEYHLNEGYINNNQTIGLSLTQAMVQELNTLVLKSLHKHKIPAVSIPPHSSFKINDKEIEGLDFSILTDYIKIGITPVTFGDVILDKKIGFSICSGDLMILALSEYFKPEKVIFVIDEDGLYSSNPKIDKKAKFIEEISLEQLKKLSTSLDKHDDVTGGMGGKIDTIKKIAKTGVNTYLLNGNTPNRLYKTLIGKKTKRTIIFGEKK